MKMKRRKMIIFYGCFLFSLCNQSLDMCNFMISAVSERCCSWLYSHSFETKTTFPWWIWHFLLAGTPNSTCLLPACDNFLFAFENFTMHWKNYGNYLSFKKNKKLLPKVLERRNGLAPIFCLTIQKEGSWRMCARLSPLHWTILTIVEELLTELKH